MRGYCPTCYPIVRDKLEKRKQRRLAKEAPSRYPWPALDEIALLREFGRRDFWTNFQWVFGAAANPKGKRWISPEVHEPMARWFQKHVMEWYEARERGEGIEKCLAILVHREVGKTTMFSQAGQEWLHLLDPELAIATGSEKLELAEKIVAGVRAVMDGSDPYALFPRLYGNWATNARQWSGRAMVHGARKNTSRRDPSMSVFGVETSITGSHPDVIFYDDPISYERMMTDTSWLQMVNEQVASLFPVIQKDGLTVWVGTRYDDEDHFGVAFRDEGVKSLEGLDTDQITVDPSGKWDVYFLAGRDQEGKPTTPKVWPEWRLQRYQRKDPLKYAAQVMNDPQLSEFNPITKEQIAQCLVDAKDVPWNALRYGFCCDYAFWDGASRAKKDETVFIIHGYPRDGSGDIYVIEVHGSPTWRAEDFGHRLVAAVQRYRKQGRRVIGIGGDKIMALQTVWESQLRNYFADANEPMPPYYEFQRGGKGSIGEGGSTRGATKVARMVNMASYWVDGHVKVVKDGPGVEKLMDQMSRIGQYMVNPRMRNDYADAHADAVQPEFYNPMRRGGSQKPPYERGSIPLSLEGLDRGMFDDSDYGDWLRECPREPIR